MWSTICYEIDFIRLGRNNKFAISSQNKDEAQNKCQKERKLVKWKSCGS